ncbi:hypothetical protein ACNKHN_22650 [Shigella flexneri]
MGVDGDVGMLKRKGGAGLTGRFFIHGRLTMEFGLLILACWFSSCVAAGNHKPADIIFKSSLIAK